RGGFDRLGFDRLGFDKLNLRGRGRRMTTQRELADQLRERTATVARGGSERARAQHVARGKLLPRERVERLLDDGSPFLEIAPLAAYGVDDPSGQGGAWPAAGVVAGIGLVSGRQVMV